MRAMRPYLEFRIKIAKIPANLCHNVRTSTAGRVHAGEGDPEMTVPYYAAHQVEALLDFPGGIQAMREAMASLSAGGPQPLRQIFPLGDERLFAVMPGSLEAQSLFGAKVISFFPQPGEAGRWRHRGMVLCFDGETGEPVCLADAEAVTTIRTACASAAATDALARADADVLAVFGTGTQAASHIRALAHVRPFRKMIVWGRSEERAAAMAARFEAELGVPVTGTTDGQRAAREAQVICTTSSSAEPILLHEWIRPGTHVNLVGSSFLGPVEVDSALVAAGRYFADYRPSVLAQAAEFAVARDAGLITDEHVVGEIGDVFAGRVAGREDEDQLTIYKSLGHVVQDLAAALYVHRRSSIGS